MVPQSADAKNKPMASSIRFLFGVLTFALAAASAVHAQTSPNPVQILVAQYEKLPVSERIAFLQTIALIGLETPATIMPPSATSAEKHSETEVKQTVAVEDILPESHKVGHSLSDIKLAPISSPVTMTMADESPVETLVTTPVPEQSSQTRSKDLIRLIAKPQSQGAAKDNSVFYLLLDNYNQKIINPLQKIQAQDLRDEAISFYIEHLKQQLGNCDYDVVSDDPQTKELASDLQLETDLTRIAVNKTLLETAVIGEATAKITQPNPESIQPEIRTVIHARATQSLSGSGNHSELVNQLKSALGAIISQLSDQISEKICSIRP